MHKDHKDNPSSNEDLTYQDGGILLKSHLEEIKGSVDSYQREDRDYKKNQLLLNLFLVIGTFLGIGIGAWQAHIASKNALAAQDNAAAAKAQAEAAKEQVEEIRKGSTDTHELAVQAKNQADRTKDIAESTLKQSAATNTLATEAKRQADVMQGQSAPWVGLENNQVTFEDPEWGFPRHKAEVNISLGDVTIGPGKTFTSKPFSMTNLYVGATYSIKNFGTLPALHEQSAIIAIPDSGATVPPTSAIGQACSYAESLDKSPGAANPGAGSVILPGQVISEALTTNLELAQGHTDLERVWLFLCIVYQEPGGHAPHHTKYWFRSTFKEPAYRTPIPGRPDWTYVPSSGMGLWGAEED